ncbi:MAG TPA: hypothetical protein VML19_14205 [Verrucomicrobiae bacterium]|nr:hypothetical protein [Verrucomicrobiae bacterium]
MRSIAHVEQAKALLEEGQQWGVWKWLTEKKRVRAAADLAWADLEKVEKEIKASWNEDLRAAYRELQLAESADGNTKAREDYEKAVQAAKGLNSELKAFAKRLWKEDAAALSARMAAEETFDEAEQKLSVPLAQRGSTEAIAAFEKRERFIRKADAARQAPEGRR